MTVTLFPVAPKGAVAARPSVPAAKVVLRATWSLDPETGRPVCRWSAEGSDTPTPNPVPIRQAA
ncbi:hypothetical protein DA075_00320 [Methylobacterium currus]|uniref:Uncharacterized protein n=1 Tax=Methylobacterium currus TaxID=2051553 RepID=A0A2R4WDG8_9HYPH|nr:hypothetical protein [Methylobacterium currus]AWB19570.1 hypothetical protein DA075_00320 [Methylobacterium currus]UHC15730.1 hypothetical protein LRS73_25035 [Methylobacterium currus]